MKPVNVKNGKLVLPRGLHACFLAGLLLAATGALAQEPAPAQASAPAPAPVTATVASSDLTLLKD